MGSVPIVSFFPKRGETCRVTVNDNASIALSEKNTYVMMGDADHGGRTVLNWNSSKTIIAYNSFAVGMGNGYGELNLASGTVNGRDRGLKLGENGITAREKLFPTGVVNVTDGTLWLSYDGEGVLEVGPNGTVTAANVTLTNTPAALTGGADLAAKVRFTCGPQGVGTLDASGTFTIGPGATLEVDSTAPPGGSSPHHAGILPSGGVARNP